jgi:hypothetical protein
VTDGDQRSWSAPTPRLTRRRVSPGGVEFGRVLKLVGSRVESPGRRTGRPRLGYLRGQAEVAKGALHYGRGFKQRHQAQSRSGGTPGRRIRTSAASGRPTDRHRGGTAHRGASASENFFKVGTAEIKNWYPVIAAMNAAGKAYHQVDYVPCYRSEAGTGNAMCFAYWE